jgi:phasin family protein
MTTKTPKKRPTAHAAAPAATPVTKVIPSSEKLERADYVDYTVIATEQRPRARDIAHFGEGDLAAVVQANTALVKGFEAIGLEVFAYAQTALGDAVRVARAMIDARSVVDVIALNGEFARASIEGLLANSTRVSEIGMRMTSEAFGPLGERVTGTLSQMTRSKRSDAAA